ncbi:MAG TPA: hypothetical protein VLA09_08505, partial [Longimicrobiales bacterium]|nr:hypothetical protein [Longimicrobiales bacterium]
MGEISRKHFLGIGTLGVTGLATGCGPDGAGAGSLTADLVVTNGNVLTQDDTNPVARAFALKDGRFVAVGSNDDVLNLASAGTRMIDAGGGTVLPGFIDAHSHPSGAGL